MYVRTSHESIEEFNSHKIIQSLVREGSLPLELAQKITEEVENRIYKYQTNHIPYRNFNSRDGKLCPFGTWSRGIQKQTCTIRNASL